MHFTLDNVGRISREYIHFHSWCVPQLQRYPKHNGAGIETWTQSWKFQLHMDNHLFFTVRVSTNPCNSIFAHFVGWLFHTLQTVTNQRLPNYHINMISSNKLSLGSFFSQHQHLDTLYTRLKADSIICSVFNKAVY